MHRLKEKPERLAELVAAHDYVANWTDHKTDEIMAAMARHFSPEMIAEAEAVIAVRDAEFTHEQRQDHYDDAGEIRVAGTLRGTINELLDRV